jgi:hypothetical protein
VDKVVDRAFVESLGEWKSVERKEIGEYYAKWVDTKWVEPVRLVENAAEVEAPKASGFEQPTAEPPRIAEFCLALLLTKAHGDAVIGDLGENFEKDRERYGVERARRMYWGRILKSLLPLLKRWAERAIKWIITAEFLRRLF